MANIGIQIERNRAHGRGVLEGIADYQLAETNWLVELLERKDLLKPDVLAGFDGIVARVMDNEVADALVAFGKPVVDAYGRLDDNPLTSIRLDDAAIGEMAAAAFRDHYFRNCAFCGFPGIRFSEARGAAFKASVESQGGVCSVYGENSRHAFHDRMFLRERVDSVADESALATWVRKLPKPVAVFCCNDLRALQLQRICVKRRIALDRSISILGVDNDIVLCTFSKPSLSSIDTDPRALGRTAARLLDRQLRGERKKKDGPQQFLHPPRGVVERMSTAVYPFKTPWLPGAVEFIRAHLREGVSANDVVKFVGYSHPVVGRAFKEEMGMTIQKEIIRLRCNLACRLLAETDLSSAEIAVRCGYPDIHYFYHVFTESFKEPPEAWRKSWRADHAGLGGR